MTELRHLQLVILDIIKDIDAICRNNNIEYYLLGGSAIGAIRHKGFIPWDDDLDIIMTNDNYNRFIEICKTQLDSSKYFLQVGLKDWPLYFSKIRLKGTVLNEFEGYSTSDDMKGIYVDVFKMDNVSSNRLMARWQYLCGKYYLCYQLSERKYDSATLKKRIMMLVSFPLKIRFIRIFFKNQVERLNNKDSDYLGFFYGRTKLKTAITKRKTYGKPTYVPFENMVLPVPQHYHEYLTQMFGDYMKLPPLEQQRGLHLQSIEFGKY